MREGSIAQVNKKKQILQKETWETELLQTDRNESCV
jgi:hypothetical protein